VTWGAVLAACAACYVLKLAGLSLPERLVAHPRIQRVAGLLPVALLAALALIQTASTGKDLVIDARAASFAVAVVLVIRKAPFIVVVAAAVVTAALIRALTS
jgi:branched-subunit amino acid transport protein